MSKRNGFTLLEMLFVLSIISAILFISFPPLISTYEKWKVNHFLIVLDTDILYVQHKSMEEDEHVYIMFMANEYRITDANDNNKTIYRKYPQNFHANNFTNLRVSFSRNGTVMNPNTFQFKQNNTYYKVVFPFGKGRHYVEGQ